MPCRGSLSFHSAQNSYAQTVNISLSPENLNGRSAMLGFVAGAAAEVVTGQSLVQQFSENPVAVTGAAGLPLPLLHQLL